MLEKLTVRNNHFISVCYLFISAFTLVYSQEKCYMSIDEKTGELLLIGVIDQKIFYDSSEFKFISKWFLPEYNQYVFDSSSVNYLRTKIDSTVYIDVVFGTWCSDSKREIPRLMRILDEINFDKSRLKLISLDRNKGAGLIDISNYNIKLIPTIIIKRGNTEIGRIIEAAVDTIEEDLLKVLEQK